MDQFSNLVLAWVVVPGRAGVKDDRLACTNINLAVWLEQAGERAIIGMARECEPMDMEGGQLRAEGATTNRAIDWLATKYHDVKLLSQGAAEHGLKRRLHIDDGAFERWLMDAEVSFACKQAVDHLLGENRAEDFMQAKARPGFPGRA
ncbi:MAG: hypothetical protein ACOYB3_01015 [Azonexus sp.]